MSPTGPLFDPADFRIEAGVAHLCAAGESAFLRRHDAALLRYAAVKSSGMGGREAQDEEVEAAREAAARLLGADARELGFVSSVAEGVSLVTESLEWRAGDNVCVAGHEFPSVLYPLKLHAVERHGVELRVAEGNAEDRLERCVDGRTRVIAVSHVSFWNGERLDLSRLRRRADATGALLIVDFTHAAGVLPVDLGVADFAFTACYKFLLGTTGVAVAYWNRSRQPDWRPSTAGWNSALSSDASTGRIELKEGAARFTRGNVSYPSVYVLRSALDYLAGFDQVSLAGHVERLARELVDGLEARRMPLLTPTEPYRRGPNVCLPSGHAEQVVERLAEEGVLAWGGEGRVRFSFHGYNGSGDVERALAALDRVWMP